MNSYFRPMRILRPALILFLLLIYISSCEKDDICVDNDTPLLTIGFFDINDTALVKDVPLLRIQGLGLEDPLNTFGDRTAQNSIGIPLRVNDTSSGFVLINNSADNDSTGVETGIIDTLTFTYTVQEKFVSRGCGFVANFSDLDTIRNVYSTDWIKKIQIVEPNVEFSNQIHVKIFH